MANCSVENCMETKGIVLYGPSSRELLPQALASTMAC